MFSDDPERVVTPLTRQRRRLQTLLDALPAEAWHAQSRCEGWTVQDVVAHLAGVNDYWVFSIKSGVAGTPTRVLADFDPVAVPAGMVAAARDASSAEIAERFATSNDRLIELLTNLDDADWSAIAECPIGHVSVAVVAHHALWDCWVHERDIALPLKREQVNEHDEVLGSLAYAASLSAAMAMLAGVALPSRATIATTRPDASLVFEIDESVVVRRDADARAPRLEGDAVALLEALSVRSPLPASVPPEWRHVLAALREMFDQPLV